VIVDAEEAARVQRRRAQVACRSGHVLAAGLHSVLGAIVAAAVAGGHLLVPQPILLGLQVATTILIVALLVAYLRDAYRNTRLTAARRRFWTVVLFVGSTVAMPVYWRLYVRPAGGLRLAATEPPGQ
jgi:hypothetical protein